MTKRRSAYPPLPIVKKVCKDLGWTYYDLAIKAQKHTGTSTPGANYIAQCVHGTRRFSPDTAAAIDAATRGRIRREWLVWPDQAPEYPGKVAVG